jgi:hypothetical protein
MMADPIEELAELERQDLEGEAVKGDTQPDQNPDTDQLIAGKYKSVEEAVQATEHAQQMIGRQAQELGELRSQMEQLQAAQYQQEQPQQADDGAFVNPLFNLSPQEREQVNEAFLNDPLGTIATVLDIERQMNEQRFGSVLEERLSPLAKLSGETQAERVFNALKTNLGDEAVLRYRDEISQRIKQDPDYLKVDTKIAVDRLSDMIKAAEYDRHRTAPPTPPRDEQGRFQGATTHVEGGSTPAPQQATQTDDVDPEIAEIRASGPKQDIFGFVYAKDANNS